MHVDVNGTRLWFDVDGPVLLPEGAKMRARPTVVLLHGGPAVSITRISSPTSRGCRSARR
jgi:hypothetical protein